MTLGCKDIRIRKSEFVAKTQFLSNIYRCKYGQIYKNLRQHIKKYKKGLLYQKACLRKFIELLYLRWNSIICILAETLLHVS